MALHHNPRITTSGLVSLYDARNIKSYSGTGAIWYDAGPYKYNLALINGPTWNSSGFFSNDSDSYFIGDGGANVPTGNSPYTMFVWARQTSSWGANNGLISIGGYYSTSQSNALRTLNNTAGHFHHYWWGNDLSLQSNDAGLSLGAWFMVAASFDSITRRIWVNGISRASDTPTGHNVTSTTIQVSKTVATEYQIGDIAVAGIYNRALTDVEMLQTFTALKTRFGV